MQRQMLLPLDVNDQERLWRLWQKLPEQSRIELAALYARLIAEAVGVATSLQRKEADHEANDR